MILGIDNITPGTSTSSSLSVGGMRPYLEDLVLGLPAHFPEWQFKIFSPAWNEALPTAHPNIETVVCRSPKHRIARVLYEQTALPALIEREKVDIWLGTCNYLPLSLRCRSLLLIQSHQFFTHPDTFGIVRRHWLPWIVSQSVARADRIGVQCADAGRTLRRFTGVAPEKVRVIPNRLVKLRGSDAAPDLTRYLGRPRPYLLYVSGFYPFKNHRRLIEAFECVKHIVPDLALVLVGGGQPDIPPISPDVILTGRVPEATLTAFYRNAVASVFPSLEETFGLPVLESMSLDCPVVTSNCSSMAEIAGKAALLVDPNRVDSITGGLRRILTDPQLRAGLIARGRRRCAVFTKENTLAAVARELRIAAGEDTGVQPASPLAYNTVGGFSLNTWVRWVHRN